MVVTLVSVPQVAPVQPAPVRDQVTPSLFKSLVTVAVRARVAPAWTVVFAGGVIATLMAGTVSVTEVDEPGSATEVAVMVIVNGLAGGCAGAT